MCWNAPAATGRLRILAAIHPPDATRKILDWLGLPSPARTAQKAPRRTRAAFNPLTSGIRTSAAPNFAICRDLPASKFTYHPYCDILRLTQNRSKTASFAGPPAYFAYAPMIPDHEGILAGAFQLTL